MKATELRIGNWVADTEEIQTVTQITKDYCSLDESGGVDWFDIKFIPLTEEWLEKFGFELIGDEDLGYNWVKDNFVIYTDEENLYTYISLDIKIELKYVHILQNAFALTGKELKLKK